LSEEVFETFLDMRHRSGHRGAAFQGGYAGIHAGISEDARRMWSGSAAIFPEEIDQLIQM
jgi:hypothetical protein